MSFKSKIITITNRIQIKVDLEYSLVKSLDNYNVISLKLLNLVITSVVITVTNCLLFLIDRSIMASNSDHQEQISLYIQLLTLMIDELSFVSHDFSVLVLPLQVHLNLLKILYTTNLHLENSVLFVLNETRRTCTQVRKDVRQFFKSNSVDLSFLKS